MSVRVKDGVRVRGRVRLGLRVSSRSCVSAASPSGVPLPPPESSCHNNELARAAVVASCLQLGLRVRGRARVRARARVRVN